MARNRLYDQWHGMVRRCHDPRRKDYPKYGGRGIKVCDEWRESYDAFEAWAFSHGYKEGLTLDRICNHRGYEPGNCRWISSRQQNYNRKTNRYITIGGRTRTLEQWAAERGLGPDVILHRIERGWSEEEAILIPNGVRRSDYKGLRKEKGSGET